MSLFRWWTPFSSRLLRHLGKKELEGGSSASGAGGGPPHRLISRPLKRFVAGLVIGSEVADNSRPRAAAFSMMGGGGASCGPTGCACI
jgi:hypothetical protein